MNRTNDATRAQILRCLTEGNSIRSTSRLTGASLGTILRLLNEVGTFCEIYSDHKLRNLKATRVECDEQWSFVGCKQRNAKVAGEGDAWVYCAIDAETKLVFSWLVGERDYRNTQLFMDDVASRCGNRVQLTTDGFGHYHAAVRHAFKFARVDFAELIKTYGTTTEDGPARRYSAPVVTAIRKVRRIGKPVKELVSTSYVERLNLGTRQSCRRFTRLTNAFSKKMENHCLAIALHYFVHNFAKAHGTLTKKAGKPTSPAMASGLTDHVWTMEGLLAMMSPDRLLQ